MKLYDQTLDFQLIYVVEHYKIYQYYVLCGDAANLGGRTVRDARAKRAVETARDTAHVECKTDTPNQTRITHISS